MSLIRATIADARSPVIGGAIVPHFGPPPPPPVYGMTFATVPDLEAAIAENPGDFVDGTPVYITSISYDTPLLDDPIVTDGWVIIYSLTPTPVTAPSVDHYQYWIDVYSPPSGTFTFIDPESDGSGTIFVNDGGTPTTVPNLGVAGSCIVGYSTNLVSARLDGTGISGDPISSTWTADTFTEIGDIR